MNREPRAWIMGGDYDGREDGWIDAMAWQEGEFSTPLYEHPAPAVPDPVAAAVEAEREAADAKLIAAVDRWICLYQPMIATAAKHKRTQAEERGARNVLAFVAAEWAATHRDPRAIVEAARARSQGEQKP